MTRAPLALKIAYRLLAAPKTHGAVSSIALISIIGVAVATAAIVIVLSVFNGFRYHLNLRLDTLTPEISVYPAKGKTIQSADSLVEVISALPEVSLAMPEVSDQALVIAHSREMPVTLKGVHPDIFSRITSIDSLLIDGYPIETYSDNQVSASVGVAQRLGIYSAGDSLFLFTPKRIGRVNMANPAASFLSDSVAVGSVFRSLQNEYDENTVICHIDLARNLFQYEDEATGILIQTVPGTDVEKVKDKLSEMLGDTLVVKDRGQLQEINFRMVEIEKWLSFILLTFILVIASFNIISTLCMLVLDSGQNISTLSHLGLSKNKIGDIFWWESILITALGGCVGLGLGLALSMIQEKFSIIKLAGDPESLTITAYPVKVEGFDMLYTMIPVVVIGLICAFISRQFAKSRV